MDDQVLMGVRDGIAYLKEQPQCTPDVQIAGILVDRHTINLLHDKVRLPVVCVAGIEQECNARVVERSQYLAFREETLPYAGIIRAWRQQLHGDFSCYLAVHSLGGVDGSHAAATQNLAEMVGSTAAL